MKKTIIISLLALVIGIAIGLVGGMAYYGATMAKSMFMFQEMEVVQFEEAAVDAYKNQPTEVAIWALEYNIKSLNVVKEQHASANTDNPYILLIPENSLMISHGRLSKLYKKLNNEEKYKYHVEKAISIGNETKSYKFATGEKLLEFIDKLDASSQTDQENDPDTLKK